MPTGDVSVGVIIFLLGVNATLIGVVYRSLVARIDKLERRFEQLSKGLIAMAVLLDPQKAREIFAVFEIPVPPREIS